MVNAHHRLMEPACPVGTFVFPKDIEGFLEQIGPYRLEVLSENFLDLGFLTGGYICG